MGPSTSGVVAIQGICYPFVCLCALDALQAGGLGDTLMANQGRKVACPNVCTRSYVSLFAIRSEARFGRSPSTAKAGTGRWCRTAYGAGGL